MKFRENFWSLSFVPSCGRFFHVRGGSNGLNDGDKEENLKSRFTFNHSSGDEQTALKWASRESLDSNVNVGSCEIVKN